MEKGIFAKVLDFFKRIGKEFFYFISSTIFIRNFVGMLAFTGLLLMLVFGWLRCYTKHGESREVHNYIGLDLEDARDKAVKRSFNIVISDSLYVRDKEPNVVLDQNPKPLSEVKENRRKIYLKAGWITEDKNILDLLKDGIEEFEKKVAQRIIKSEKIIFNNCPKSLRCSFGILRISLDSGLMIFLEPTYLMRNCSRASALAGFAASISCIICSAVWKISDIIFY